MTDGIQLLVIAKEPVAGQVKTRLCPPCTPAQAASIAEASLADTLATVAAAGSDAAVGDDRFRAARRVIALDGAPGPWLPNGFEVIGQEGDGLDERLTNAFIHCFQTAPDLPTIIVGMDTPQLTAAHLSAAADALRTDDAVLGPAPDGGYWLIGLRHLAPGAITGVPMSTADTFHRQHDRLVEVGYHVAVIDALLDVDTADDARAVAQIVPSSRFADAVNTALP